MALFTNRHTQIPVHKYTFHLLNNFQPNPAIYYVSTEKDGNAKKRRDGCTSVLKIFMAEKDGYAQKRRDGYTIELEIFMCQLNFK